MNFEKKSECSNFNYESQSLKLCNRCGIEFGKHPNPENFERECDNPRYLQNKNRDCRCKRTPLVEMSQRQREERDPAWKVNTHCCFCKRATTLVQLRTKEINGVNYEQCYHCKDMIYVPEKEEFFKHR